MMVLGKLVLVENTGSGRGSANYNQLTYLNTSGELEHILLTGRELDVARERAAKNSEDINVVGLLDRLVSWFVRLVG